MLPACGAPRVMRNHKTPLLGRRVLSLRAAVAQNGLKDIGPELPRLTGLGQEDGKGGDGERKNTPCLMGQEGGQSPPPGTPSLIREMGNINMARTFIWLVLVLKISRNNLSYFQQIRLRILSIYEVHYTQSLSYPTDTEPSKTALQGGVVSAPTPTPLTRA